MDLLAFCDRMRQEVDEYAVVGRTKTSAFLIWFIENFFRLEPSEAIASVCDQQNDKGIDGICVDDDDEIIYLFQSKFSPVNDAVQGDVEIRNFVGAREWFRTEETVQLLLDGTASRELKALVNSLSIKEKVNYKTISVFITNKVFNTHAQEYIRVTSDLESWDKNNLFDKYTYFADAEISFPSIDLRLSNTTKIEYNLTNDILAKVYSIPAKELVKLQGIQDRTLFYKNVRYGVGNTRVNKSIKDTITNSDEHRNFFLYHNGITIICSDLVEDIDNHRISISNYAVINGCQSILTFFENRNSLTNSLTILVKIIKMNPTSPLVKTITYYANNQNSISMKDLKSNDSVQKALQKEFLEIFNGQVQYIRKKGESEDRAAIIIEKDFAAQLIEAVYLSSPHNTHLKQKLFGEDYTKIFSRKISADKIFLCYSIYSLVKENMSLIDNVRIRDYGLAIFFFSFTLSEIMRKDRLGAEILDNPQTYVTTQHHQLIQTITKIWELMTPDINLDIEEYTNQNEGFFDYKNLFKNSHFVKTMSERIKSDYIRMTRRNNGDSFESIFGDQTR